MSALSSYARAGRRVAAVAALGLVASAGSVLAAPAANAAPIQIQILATNDFHGRLISEGTTGTSVAGAAQFAGAIEQTRADFAGPTLFAAAGDLVGASTFESFIQQDKPTIDAMNAMGLAVSAAGNHEFDQGYADLANRIMKPASASNPNGGADWQYLAANVRKKSDNSYALPDVAASPGTSDGGTWIADMGGVKVGFVGAVTEDLPSLVSPAGIADVKITGIVDEVKAGAAALRSAGADMVVMLVHEGASKTDCAATSDGSAFGKIVTGVGNNVNAIISGHTHLAYNCTVGGVPVVSSGQYGTNFNVLKFTVDPDTDAVTVDSQAVKSANTVTLTAPAAIAKKAQVKSIVDAAIAQGNTLGAKELGQVKGGFYRARMADGTTENRGGESTLGNMVAEVQRWATSSKEAGEAQIAFMNPGGLRQDMVGNNAAGYPAALTYKQAAVVQPFANTLVNMKLTGAQIKTVLEQQWQRDKDGKVPSRPFLRLGTSDGFFSTYDVTRPEGDRVTGMWLDGVAIDPATSYSVTVNSFLASGGDNFFELAKGTGARDTGKVDLQAMVDYMAAFASGGKSLDVSYQQHQVGLTWPAGAPKFYRMGERVKFNLSSLAMTDPHDARDLTLKLTSGQAKLQGQKVDNTVGVDPVDEAGTSAVSFKLTKKVMPGKPVVTLTGSSTGSKVEIPLTVKKAKAKVKAKSKAVKVGKAAKVTIKVKAKGLGKVKGKVKITVNGKTYKAKLKKGKAVIKVKPFKKAGKKQVKIKFLGSKIVKPKHAKIKIKVKKG